MGAGYGSLSSLTQYPSSWGTCRFLPTIDLTEPQNKSSPPLVPPPPCPALSLGPPPSSPGSPCMFFKALSTLVRNLVLSCHSVPKLDTRLGAC